MRNCFFLRKGATARHVTIVNENLENASFLPSAGITREKSAPNWHAETNILKRVVGHQIADWAETRR